MSTHACKLITSDGAFYVAYDTIIDQFISETFRSIERLAEFMGEDLESCQAEADRYIYDMSRGAIHDASYYLSQLKLGKTLKVAEMRKLSNFVAFLTATVAPHQWTKHFPEIGDETVKEWVRELGLDKTFPTESVQEIIIDHALYPAFKEADQRHRFRKGIYHGRRMRPRVGQNKLAGRYVSKLAIIANVAGPDKTPPEKIVERFYKFMQEHGTGG